ncbi:hypothetical protein [Companilactobacillus musae]|uniref:hypothetical protein n=2 Tax=Companilactobacillus musae TaxID=1903258 RepID=UPI000F825822|nr:hypothetical protein [Companilactobacillus musae]
MKSEVVMMLSTIDKVSELLQDDSITIFEIHNATGINLKTIKELRKSKDLAKAINNLKYNDVLVLEDFFNDVQINYINGHDDNDFYKFVIRMGDWFDESMGIQQEYYQSEEGLDDDLMIATAIQTLNDISTRNKSIMLDLYFSYSRDEQNI